MLSHGDGRIYRFAYADEIYVDMMYLSLSYWGELNDATTALYANPTASEVAGYGATGSVKTGPSGEEPIAAVV